MKKYIIILIIIFVNQVLFTQEIKTQIGINGNNLNINLKIFNNTNKDILIPLNDWIINKNESLDLEDLSQTYLYNIISNINSTNRRVISAIDYDTEPLLFDNIPLLLRIPAIETKEINIVVDTINFTKHRKNGYLENAFLFKLSIADIDVLKELFKIMKLNYDDYIIDDVNININLTEKKSNEYYCRKYKSKTKLVNEYKKLISLPFLKYITFSSQFKND